jgi:hypothetical protein
MSKSQYFQNVSVTKKFQKQFAQDFIDFIDLLDIIDFISGVF